MRAGGQTAALSGTAAAGRVSNWKSVSAGAAAGAPVAGGPYVITASNATGTPNLATNYDITYLPGSLALDLAPLAIRAEAASISGAV